MTSDDKFAIAAHLYVLLRRKCGRVIDTVWMARDVEYALEVLRVAREQGDADITRLADRFETLMFGEVSSIPAPSASISESAEPLRKYVGNLR
jgi:hypothetical protein